MEIYWSRLTYQKLELNYSSTIFSSWISVRDRLWITPVSAKNQAPSAKRNLACVREYLGIVSKEAVKAIICHDPLQKVRRTFVTPSKTV